LPVVSGLAAVRSVSCSSSSLWCYCCAADRRAGPPKSSLDQAQRIMEEAHKTCPYSKALRGDTSVKLLVD
jgi:organic hydroperoxide reductase OsmC/OhrA